MSTLNTNSAWTNSDAPNCGVSFKYEIHHETLYKTDNTYLRMRTSAVKSATLDIPVHAWQIEKQFLRIAVNNRTRERNYANLCLRLAEGEITEEEFDREIIENEDRYVITFQDAIPEENVCIAARLTDGLLDIETEDDFRELFSINTASIIKALGKNE
ncbi:MAG: hypothetical protein HDR80_00460 [Bacteroides sp.]|nr:hypothetical protein [Bacteroides sp.]